MFRNKEYVLAIVREGGFSKAAEKLYVSQPSLSATVKRIEDKLPTPIFDRTTTPVTLTELGREYVRCAVEIEQREKDFELYASEHANIVAGEVKIGASSLFSSFLLPPMIEVFNKEYPAVTVKIFENNTKNLLRELADGSLDIIIDNAVINAENISSSVYCAETILLAVPSTFELDKELLSRSFTAEDIRAGQHLTKEGDTDLCEFISLPFILLNNENDTGKRALGLFKKHELTPNVLFRLDQQITSYNIASSGMGVCFVSDILVKNVSTSQAVRFFKLRDTEINRNVYIYRKSNRYFSRACQKFAEFNSVLV